MSVIDNLAVSYERHKQEWVDRISEAFSAYVDTNFSRLDKNDSISFHNDSFFVSTIPTWRDQTEIVKFLREVNDILLDENPFPAKYVGKYK